MKEKTQSKRRKAARPDEIITAALAEFAEKGFAASKLENIAKRAGVVKGTIYRYFPSKEALFEAALQPHAVEVFDQLDQMIDSFSGKSTDLLRMVIAQVYTKAFSKDLFILLRIIISEGGHFPDIAQNYHKQIVTKGLIILKKITQRGVDQGEFRNSPALENPVAIIGPLIATMVWKMTFDKFEPIDPETMAKSHIDLILNGLIVRDGQ